MRESEERPKVGGVTMACQGKCRETLDEKESEQRLWENMRIMQRRDVRRLASLSIRDSPNKVRMGIMLQLRRSLADI